MPDQTQQFMGVARPGATAMTICFCWAKLKSRAAIIQGHGFRKLRKIDTIVTHVVMPRMGGPELVEKLKQKRNDFVVIFMSGYTEAAALENAKIGAEAILLNKPFFGGAVSSQN